MVICIFGESCTGKSTLAGALQNRLGGAIYTGKDYLRLAKGEAEAKARFTSLLREALSGREGVIFVATEKEHLALVPQGAFRVLAQADLGIIKTRFAGRMGGNLPGPVAQMLERKHGMFDSYSRDYTYDGSGDPEAAAAEIERLLGVSYTDIQ